MGVSKKGFCKIKKILKPFFERGICVFLYWKNIKVKKEGVWYYQK